MDLTLHARGGSTAAARTSFFERSIQLSTTGIFCRFLKKCCTIKYYSTSEKYGFWVTTKYSSATVILNNRNRARIANGMDTTEWRNWWHFVKECETLHNQKNYYKYPQRQHKHQHQQIHHTIFHHQHNTTQYHTSNSKCKSIP
jgi:hypothetical protein